MSNSNDSNCSQIQNWCYAQILCDEVDVIWTIHDFSSIEDRMIKSFESSSAMNDKLKWCLMCSSYGVNGQNDSVVFSLYLRDDMKINKPKIVFAKCTISISDSSLKSTQAFLLRPDKIASYTWPKFVEKNESFRNKFLKYNDLTIFCNILFSVIDDGTSLRLSKSNIEESNLSKNLELLFENQDFSDAIISVQDKNFPVHKNILAARSTVFSAMFKHDMKESREARIVVEDVNGDVMEEMLRYIYTGNCKNLKKFAAELLVAAEKYALNDLKILCVKELVVTLSVENAVNRLVFADLYHLSNLKSKTIQFIVFTFSKIVVSMDWKDKLVTHPELINEVCQAIADRLTTLDEKLKKA